MTLMRRDRLLIAATLLAVVAFVAFATWGIASFVDRREKTDARERLLTELILDQARENGHYTACVASFLRENDPPMCADVKADLARQGIPLTRATTTTTPS